MKKGIFGAGGFGREIFHGIGTRFECVFFVDDVYYSEQDNTLPISLFDPNEYELIIAIGDPLEREKIVDKLPHNTKYFTYIDDRAIILDKNIEIGEGSVICANTVITTNVQIGKHCHINLSSTIGHDVILKNFVTLSPSVNISGNCEIGNLSYIGTNSSIREKIKICDGVKIGLNSGVIRDITEIGTYVGNPAKKVEKK